MVDYGKAYNRILDKVNNGVFKKGTNYRFGYAFEIVDINEYSEEHRSPELCAWLMHYCRCTLEDVPVNSRTREFYLNGFIDSVKEYIANNLQEFDREFFKDLLATERYSTSFSNNCFEIMPLEYIDEEMCSLAMLISTDWTTEDWFLTVVRRKPEALSKDLWECAVQFYSQVTDIISICPEEYKDEEFYLAACCPTFNVGMTLRQEKNNIMDRIPKEMLTNDFLKKLINRNPINFYRFSETAFEMSTDIVLNGSFFKNIKWWEIALYLDAQYIRTMKLNDERIGYFELLYPPTDYKYDLYLKDLLKDYGKTA